MSITIKLLPRDKRCWNIKLTSLYILLCIKSTLYLIYNINISNIFFYNLQFIIILLYINLFNFIFLNFFIDLNNIFVSLFKNFLILSFSKFIFKQV